MYLLKKILKFNLSFLVIFLFAFIFKTDIFAQENLVPNPSFENGSTSPEGWVFISTSVCLISRITQTPNFSWDSSNSYTGSHSIAIKGVDLPSGGTINGAWTTSEFIPVSAFQDFNVHAMVEGLESNRNLKPIIQVCFYDKDGNPRFSTATSNLNLSVNGPWGEAIHGNVRSSHPDIVKAKIFVSAGCAFLSKCSGDLWFDDLKMYPSWTIYAHKFEDVNKNRIQDLGEPNVFEWPFYLYKGKGCQEPYPGLDHLNTHKDGTALFQFDYPGRHGVPAGDYSVKEFLQPGWTNITTTCKNITTEIGNSAWVEFGNVRTSTPFPYFSQTDPIWGQDEFDHASQFGSFFCGTTIAQCGCATTSAAMLLAYHGVTHSPSGEPTNPQTLNNWLKENNGYAFGALKWNSIASYSVAANKQNDTQKIAFVGAGKANNYAALDLDLNAAKPAILNVPNHFVLATKKTATTYNINDPFWQERKTLDEYSNSFSKMIRYEKTASNLSAIYIQTPSPGELIITDSTGAKTGKDPQTGEVFQEIPNSFYFKDEQVLDQGSEPAQTPEDSGINTLVILTPQAGDFKITTFGSKAQVEFSTYDQDGNINVNKFENLPNNQTFSLNYTPQIGQFSTLTKDPQKVEIEVIPGSTTSPVVTTTGTIPVTLFSSEDFDATNTNFETLLFGPNGAKPVYTKGVKVDLNSDSKLDLLLLFNSRQTGVQKDDTEICLTGQTQDANLFIGCDSIKVIR